MNDHRPALRSALVVHRERVAALGRRTRQVVLFAAVTGALTGLAGGGFEWLTSRVVFERVQGAPLWAIAAAPAVGLALAALALRFVAGGAGPATADEYIRNFHESGERLNLRAVPGRILASVFTLGLGGAMGYEGPSIYAGAALGSGLQRRFSRYFSREDAKVLLVAGAAAGVAAIFKAPVTGLVFALEVPFQEDFARRMLGRTSLSPYQVAARAGHLERRFELPLTAALRTDVATVPPDATLHEFFWQHLIGNREKAVAVVAGTWV